MPDDLRQRYAEALAETCKRHWIEGGCVACGRRLAVVLAVRDTELESARAALARVRNLAGAMLHEAYCAGHPDVERWRAEYAALDSLESR